MSTISVIGTGLMGSAIARQLYRSGFDVGVWNRTSARAQDLRGQVTRTHHSVTEALQNAGLVIMCVADYSTAEALLAEASAAVAGRDVVNLVTGSPADAVRLNNAVTSAGGRYLDGAIEAYPDDIGRSATLINLSGSAEVWRHHRDALLCLAGGSKYLGEVVGAANAADVAFAGAFFNVAIGGFLEATSYALSAGMSTEDVESSLDYWMTLLAGTLRHGLTAVRTNDYSTDQATLDVYLAAVRSWRATMIDAGQRASLMTANMHNLEIASAAGYGAQAISAQIKTADNCKPRQPEVRNTP